MFLSFKVLRAKLSRFDGYAKYAELNFRKSTNVWGNYSFHLLNRSGKL